MQPKLILNYNYKNEQGEEMSRFTLSLNLSQEDIHIILSIIKPKMEQELGRELPVAEVMQACLTLGIHRAYEDITGKPFTLRMDRPKKKA